MIMREWSGRVWQAWFKSLDELYWDVAEVREFFDGKLPAGVELLVKLGMADRDTVKLGAAVESLAEILEAWSLPRMELHVKSLQATYPSFEDFGKAMCEEHQAVKPGVLPDDVPFTPDGKINYAGIGEYYVRSADLVHPGVDGRVFFFLRPGFEGQGR